MKDEQRQFLALCGRAPARLTVEQTAWLLNCQAHDIPTLVAARLLRPLGNPPANGTKYFAASEILELSTDQSWLSRMTNTIHQFWKKKNGERLGTGNDQGFGAQENRSDRQKVQGGAGTRLKP